MEKIKGVFSKIGAFIKSHVKVIVPVVAVVVVALLVVNFVVGADKRAVKKFVSALNSCKDEKIIKAMNTEAALAWGSATEESIKKFEDRLKDVKSESVDKFEEKIKDSYKESKKGEVKYKILKVVSVNKAKDNKNIKKVVCKVRATYKVTEDDKEAAKENKVWKNQKAYKQVVENYATFYLYKNKVIAGDLVPSGSSSSYDLEDLYNYLY